MLKEDWNNLFPIILITIFVLILIYLGKIFIKNIYENPLPFFIWLFFGLFLSGIGIYLTEKEIAKISHSIEYKKNPSEIKKHSKRLNKLFSGGIF